MGTSTVAFYQLPFSTTARGIEVPWFSALLQGHPLGHAACSEARSSPQPPASLQAAALTKQCPANSSSPGALSPHVQHFDFQRLRALWKGLVCLLSPNHGWGRCPEQCDGDHK